MIETELMLSDWIPFHDGTHRQRQIDELDKMAIWLEKISDAEYRTVLFGVCYRILSKEFVTVEDNGELKSVDGWTISFNKPVVAVTEKSLQRGAEMFAEGYRYLGYVDTLNNAVDLIKAHRRSYSTAAGKCLS